MTKSPGVPVSLLMAVTVAIAGGTTVSIVNAAELELAELLPAVSVAVADTVLPEPWPIVVRSVGVKV